MQLELTAPEGFVTEGIEAKDPAAASDEVIDGRDARIAGVRAHSGVGHAIAGRVRGRVVAGGNGKEQDGANSGDLAHEGHLSCR